MVVFDLRLLLLMLHENYFELLFRIFASRIVTTTLDKF
jgi:hypothetical protein